MPRVQGEGDYESARRFNTRTRKFVAQQSKRGGIKKAEGGVDEGALRKARSKSRAGAQDKRDAQVFRKLTSSGTRKKTARRATT
ncbi:MAG TPA: hypothetical protein VIL32_01180 [Steroidobacteraceae bacterium]